MVTLWGPIFDQQGVPIITSLVPGTEEAGNTITILGERFAGGAQVDFGGVATSSVFISSRELTATVPAGTGTVHVHVTNPVGAVSAEGPQTAFEYVVDGPSGNWDVTAVSFTQHKALTSEPIPVSLFFRDDGLKMYVGGSGTTINGVGEYTLSTAWDINTATFVQRGGITGTASPGGLFFKPDGTRMYYISSSGGSFVNLHTYTLSTPWNIATRSHMAGSPTSLSALYGGLTTATSSLSFKSDGTKVIVGRTEWSLSTPWLVSSISFVADNASLPPKTHMRADGTRVFGLASNVVRQWDVSVAWDILSSTSGASINVSAQDSDTRSIFWSADGTKMYTMGITNDRVYQYDVV